MLKESVVRETEIDRDYERVRERDSSEIIERERYVYQYRDSEEMKTARERGGRE